jgi:hypothetical protein
MHMDRNDRQAIEDLFVKLENVEGRAPPRDAEAEAFIGDRIARQPGAPYYMAQTIVVQEQALAAAQARIEELEGARAEESRGGFRMPFGRERDQPADREARRGSVPSVGRGAPAAGGAGFGRGGGGFLAGAAQTAMGVAGGFLLGNAIAGMFGGSDEAQAAESTPADAPADEPGIDEAPADDGGFDLGGMDDFEF